MKSEQLFEEAKKFVPGGVHSPVRSFKGLSLTPRFIERAKGAYIYDVDGKSYIDFCMSFGPMILGHANPKVASSLKEAIDRGWSFGACEHYSTDLCEHIVDNLSNVEQVRLVNSGTEAVMTALRLARGYTKKDKIIKFNGCYHGHTDSMLIKAGSGLAGVADASSQGVPQGVAKDTLIFELGDMEGVKSAFENFKDQIACIIIEPLPANNGLLIQDVDFLNFLRKISSDNDALLIFDEVISGFRCGFGGMSAKTKIRPDIITFGKIIGGGMPVGAIASSTNIMQTLAPTGGVYQAGTLSANPLAMVAGLETLSQLNKDVYKTLESTTIKIADLFRAFFDRHSEFKHLKVVTFESLFWITPDDTIKRVCDIPNNLMDSFRPLFENLIKRGIYLAPNPYEVGFVSCAHDEKVLEDLKKKLS